MEDFKQVVNVFLSNSEVKRMFFLFLTVLILIFIFGFLFDWLYKDQYKIKKMPHRTLNSSLGGGQEYYYKYWIWQRQKKKCINKTLSEQLGITMTYSRHSMKNKRYVKSLTPFRREVYCIVK